MSNKAIADIYQQSEAEAKKQELKSDTRVDTKGDVNHDVHHDTTVDTLSHYTQLPTADQVENTRFTYRKLDKVRANADIPIEWKKDLDEYAHRIGVNKYHLVWYAVAKMMEKV